MVTKPGFPEWLFPYFWDCAPESLSWEVDRDFIIRRVLQAGSWQALSWLREELGDILLRQWIEQHHGADLSPRQLRFWELLIDLPQAKVALWLHTATTFPWEQRLTR